MHIMFSLLLLLLLPSPTLPQVKFPTHHAHGTAKSPNCSSWFYLHFPQFILYRVGKVTFRLHYNFTLGIMTKNATSCATSAYLSDFAYTFPLFAHHFPNTIVASLFLPNTPVFSSFVVLVLALPVAWNAFLSGNPLATFV